MGTIPVIRGLTSLVIAEEIIHLDEEGVQPGGMLNSPPDPGVEPAGGLIKGANPNAIRAIPVVGGPEAETFLGINGPAE